MGMSILYLKAVYLQEIPFNPGNGGIVFDN
jgi:hypothetical protein